MSVLEQLTLQMAQGMGLGLERGTDVLEGMKTGKQMAKTDQEMQIKAMEMQEYTEQRKREKRLRASMKGADFGDYESTSDAAQRASDLGEFEKAMKMEELALKQKPKKTDAFGPMQQITVGGKKMWGQYDDKGKIHNLKTDKQMTGKDGLAKPTKARTPTKEQITRASGMVEKSTTFGTSRDSDTWFGLSNKENKILGRLVASRGQKLISDAKQLDQTISDETAMSLALQELEGMPNITKEDLFGRSLKSEKDIAFPAGISTTLLNHLGVDVPKTGKIDTAAFAAKWAAMPKGTKYIDPNGIERIKQ